MRRAEEFFEIGKEEIKEGIVKEFHKTDKIDSNEEEKDTRHTNLMNKIRRKRDESLGKK